jgi:hypothetical protein
MGTASAYSKVVVHSTPIEVIEANQKSYVEPLCQEGGQSQQGSVGTEREFPARNRERPSSNSVVDIQALGVNY